MFVVRSPQNEVKLVLHKHMSSCYVDAELATIILINLLSELILRKGNEFTEGKLCRMHFMLLLYE